MDESNPLQSTRAAPVSKGDRTRSAILDQATSIASRLGLEGLTIGTLAEASGMSKSGLFAHFGSREELQLAVLAHGVERFAEVVGVPAFKAPRGLPRLREIFRLWLDWSVNAGLPGGCILLAASFEFDDRPGPVRDAVAATQRRGLDLLERATRIAVEEGHLRADADIKQLVFDIYGALLSYYLHNRLLGDRGARERALAAFEQRIAAASPPARHSLQAARAAARPAARSNR